MNLETELRDLALHIDHPAGDDVVGAVRRELTAPVVEHPHDRHPGRWLAIAAAALVAVVLAAATWFAVDGRGAGDSADPPRGSSGTTASVPSSTIAPAPPAGLLTVDLATARTAVDIPIRVPEGMEAEPRVTVDQGAPGGLVALEYPTFTLVEVAAPAGVSAGEVAGLGPESEVHPVSVRARPGLWITGTHREIAYRDRDGALRRGPTRTTGHVLMWVEDGVTYRVEGFHEQADAMNVADALQ